MPVFTSFFPWPRTADRATFSAVLLLVALSIFPRWSLAQLPVWAEARTIANDNGSFGYSSVSTVDANGDVIIAGGFQGTITFDPSITLTANAFRAVYVAKMDGRTHQWLWAVRASNSSSTAQAAHVAVDALGNIIIVGTYDNSIKFGTLPTLSTNSSSGAQRTFVAKLQGTTGTWLWANGISSVSSFPSNATSFAVDGAGNAILSGYFGQTVQFGNLPTLTATASNQEAGFLASLSGSTGQWQWAIKTPDAASFTGLAADAAGNLAISGDFQGSLTLGNLPPLTSSSSSRLFVAKYAPATSQWLWAAQAAASSTGVSTALAPYFSPAGDVVVTGFVQNGTFQFGTLPAVVATQRTLYIAKLAGSSGTWQWINAAPTMVSYSTLAFDATGAILAAGTFASTVQLGPALSLTSRGDQDVFISKLNTATGQAQWALQAGGPKQESIHSVTLTATGDALVTGTFQQQADFGSQPTVTGANVATFLARLSLSPFAITQFFPARNATAAPPSAPVGVIFSQPVAPFPTAAIRVFGDQGRGLKPGTISQQGAGGLTNNVITFQPTQPFSPNELLSVSVTTATASTSNATLLGSVYQFRAAVGGAGRGLFSGTDSIPGAWQSALLCQGDVDSDGDVDILTATLDGTSFTPGLNDGTGHFLPAPATSTRGSIRGMALADVDGDGDLDLVWAAHYASTDSALVSLNGGTGSFRGSSAVAVDSNPRAIALGDLNADGDLDLVVSSYKAAGSVSIRFNDGQGRFSGATAVSTGTNTYGVALGDLDNDGDLDLMASNEGSGTVSVAANQGGGSFGLAAAVPASLSPQDIALVDFDKDGDLDFISASTRANATSVTLGVNNGSGVFARTALAVGAVHGFALADIDADGDQDLLTLDQTARTVRTWLNFGNREIFFRAPTTLVNQQPVSLTVSDLDGDGDVDWLTTSSNGTLVPRFNTGVATATQPVRAAFPVSVYPNPAHKRFTVQVPAGSGPTRLLLTNSVGQQVLLLTGIIPQADGLIQVQMGSLAPGVYHLRVDTRENFVTRMLIIE